MLEAAWVSSPPQIDGEVEGTWEETTPLRVPLRRSASDGPQEVDLRALYTDQGIFFLASWEGPAPVGRADETFNKFTMHWRIAPIEEAGQTMACTVSCHTAYTDGAGQVLYANAETIPQGAYEGLRAAGGWDGDSWTMEWSRPLENANFYDLQFDDLGWEYAFFVKVFEGIAGQPDPVSDLVFLRFGAQGTR